MRAIGQANVPIQVQIMEVSFGTKGCPSTDSLRRIKCIILDVDGVLTDGSIVIDGNGVESKTFCVRDMSGLSLVRKLGYTIGFLTGRISPPLEFCAKELLIPPCRVRQGAKKKLPAFNEMLIEAGVSAEESMYVGDDLIDLPVLESAGIACCPCDAHPEVRAACNLVAAAGGGQGAVRHLLEYLLKQRQDGTWETALRTCRGL